jgi:predicted site-specific integrase-resolvase
MVKLNGEISPRRAAYLLGINPQTIWRWCREGRIDARLDVTGHYYVRIEQINNIRSNPNEWRKRFIE